MCGDTEKWVRADYRELYAQKYLLLVFSIIELVIKSVVSDDLHQNKSHKSQLYHNKMY